MVLQRLLRINTQLVASETFDSEVAIINLGNGMYYTLEGTGADLWRIIGQGRSLHSIVDALAAAYSISAEAISADIEEIATELLREGLLTIEESTGSLAEAPIEPLSGSAPYGKPALMKYYDMMDVLALDPPLPLVNANEVQSAGT